MQPPLILTQIPAPGSRLVMYSGDTLTFRLKLDRPLDGKAWIRTNLGYAGITRRERIRQVDWGESPLGRDWFDTPMVCVNPHEYRATLPVCEVGRFEAKCLFLEKRQNRPIWPDGANIRINVEPAQTCRANIIYNAFVRQFGPNRSGHFEPPVSAGQIGALDRSGYAVIPPSGTFRDLIRELDFIMGELGCRFIQLLPIHPTPTTYGRMGRFGSPYAALSFTAVDPALAVFDPAATPLEQFAELVDAVHARSGGVIIDLAINHTGWAAGLHESHPQWLVRDEQGQIEVPGAWGVRWEDLTKLDYERTDLWQYMADVFLLWCRRGVDGFRCDAGYMIPIPAWTYIIARVREQFPDTLFFLEGLGGKVSVSRALLGDAGFNWAYSELFQNYDRAQIESYAPLAIEISEQDGVMVHFAETHDNPRLASRSTRYARMRTALCALLSHQGAFGFANGVEWYATEKIDVHDARSLNWGAEPNQVAHIRQLNRLLRDHPAFGHHSRLELIHNGDGNQIVMLRRHPQPDLSLLVTVNLDGDSPASANWPTDRFAADNDILHDLLTGDAIKVSDRTGFSQVALAPGQAVCLTRSKDQVRTYHDGPATLSGLPEPVLRQRLRAKALEAYRFIEGTGDLGAFDVDGASEALAQNPQAFCEHLKEHKHETRLVVWQWPRDSRRVVMVPPDHLLLVRSPVNFSARITSADDTFSLAVETGLAASDGTWFALFVPQADWYTGEPHTLKLILYQNGGSRHIDASLLFLPSAESIRIRRTFEAETLPQPGLLFLAANDHGALMRASVSWGQLRSKYDALLSTSRTPDHPDDRWNFLARCRAWLVYQGYSQAIGDDCLESFRYHFNSAVWHFHIPTGQGETIALSITLALASNRNDMRMLVYRHPDNAIAGRLADDSPVELIVRPDIEYRNFHQTTKAYLGPEHQWPQAVTAVDKGFRFEPEKGYSLQLFTSAGTYVHEPEWHYMIHRPLEAERGLEADSDLFSPGYFSIQLNGDQSEYLEAGVVSGQTGSVAPPAVYEHQAEPADSTLSITEALMNAMDAFVVNRGGLKTIIAGYPWFLDWGRDALIFTRGLIAAGKTELARQVMLQFGRFEQNGTLPNMIRGNDTTNRDTSDAPLWFIIACRDLVSREYDHAFLQTPAGSRPIGQIMDEMAGALIHGTSNGIRMDPDSGLLLSPAHFTWMDTDHPAGTPRPGYPIEIQALWYAALKWLAEIKIESLHPYRDISQRVKQSILELYPLSSGGYLSDCLHADSGQNARLALADDALRPNQLFAVSLGAVDDPDLARSIVNACSELLVPGAVRSLADRPVDYPIAIHHNGEPLNDPNRPYQGVYAGDEDTRRKPSYHNGTAWCWLLPIFCEAWLSAYGPSARRTVRAWIGSAAAQMNRFCLGHIPEIMDGDAPHTPRGCDAQAWSVSELLRVWLMTETE